MEKEMDLEANFILTNEVVDYCKDCKDNCESCGHLMKFNNDSIIKCESIDGIVNTLNNVINENIDLKINVNMDDKPVYQIEFLIRGTESEIFDICLVLNNIAYGYVQVYGIPNLNWGFKLNEYEGFLSKENPEFIDDNNIAHNFEEIISIETVGTFYKKYIAEDFEEFRRYLQRRYYLTSSQTLYLGNKISKLFTLEDKKELSKYYPESLIQK